MADSKKLNRELIAKKMKRLRGERTQKEVADAVGITPMAMSYYESGERMPTDNVKAKLAQYFGVSVGYLFFDEKVNS